MVTDVEIDIFPEVKHPLIEPLLTYADLQLVNLCQQHQGEGKYFVAIFCRHHALVRSIITDSVSSPEEIDFLEQWVWQNIFDELPQLQLPSDPESEFESLTNWLISITKTILNQPNLPSLDLLKPQGEERLLPLNFYLELALDKLPPLHRLIFLLHEKFSWSAEQISKYLKLQGEIISLPDLEAYLQDSYSLVNTYIPEDIRLIYLENI
jgi:hypothetical protein